MLQPDVKIVKIVSSNKAKINKNMVYSANDKNK
jgi:hypothetical protein